MRSTSFIARIILDKIAGQTIYVNKVMEFTLNCLKADNSSEAHAPEEFFYGTDRKTDIVAPDSAD
jgi:hypothetical protein